MGLFKANCQLGTRNNDSKVGTSIEKMQIIHVDTAWNFSLSKQPKSFRHLHEFVELGSMLVSLQTLW